MNQNLKTTLKSLFSLVLVFLAVGGISYAWTSPTLPPTDGNVPTPLNVGNDLQYKQGPLKINTRLSEPAANGLYVWGKSIFYDGIEIPSGNPSAGQVLVATDASGTVAWGSVSGAGYWGNFPTGCINGSPLKWDSANNQITCGVYSCPEKVVSWGNNKCSAEVSVGKNKELRIINSTSNKIGTTPIYCTNNNWTAFDGNDWGDWNSLGIAYNTSLQVYFTDQSCLN